MQQALNRMIPYIVSYLDHRIGHSGEELESAPCLFRPVPLCFGLAQKSLGWPRP